LRYRLRFLLQEFDLPRGPTIIGRSLDCNLTIEDPLVSREHAQIIIDDEGARVEDLQSRNGVRVNGLLVRGPTLLRDGDRVRLGTQDLVFCGVDPNGRSHSRTTGVLRLCAKCRLPYAGDVQSCPHCEETERTDEGTLTMDAENYRVSWSMQLIVETIERALSLGRPADAERIVGRAIGKLDELILSGETRDTATLGVVASKIAGMTRATDDPRWLLWVIDLHQRTGSVPSLDVADKLAAMADRHSLALRGPLAALLDFLEPIASTGSLDEIEALARLDRTRRIVEAKGPAGREQTFSDWPGVP
jgi:hypothetical protein